MLILEIDNIFHKAHALPNTKILVYYGYKNFVSITGESEQIIGKLLYFLQLKMLFEDANRMSWEAF